MRASFQNFGTNIIITTTDILFVSNDEGSCNATSSFSLPFIHVEILIFGSSNSSEAFVFHSFFNMSNDA